MVSRECDLYHVGDMGYEAGAINNMDCDSNPHEPVSSDRKWYLRTTGPDAETKDCSDIKAESPFQPPSKKSRV